MTGRTSFVVAHRSETLQLADRVILLDKGRIVVEGTHETLPAEHGLYQRQLADIDAPRRRDRRGKRRQGARRGKTA